MDWGLGLRVDRPAKDTSPSIIPCEGAKAGRVSIDEGRPISLTLTHSLSLSLSLALSPSRSLSLARSLGRQSHGGLQTFHQKSTCLHVINLRANLITPPPNEGVPKPSIVPCSHPGKHSIQI